MDVKKLGDRVVCADGAGKVVKVTEETVYIELDRMEKDKHVVARINMDDCRLEGKGK